MCASAGVAQWKSVTHSTTTRDAHQGEKVPADSEASQFFRIRRPTEKPPLYMFANSAVCHWLCQCLKRTLDLFSHWQSQWHTRQFIPRHSFRRSSGCRCRKHIRSDWEGGAMGSIGTGSTSQMSRQYSWMDRSDENFPARRNSGSTSGSTGTDQHTPLPPAFGIRGRRENPQGAMYSSRLRRESINGRNSS